MGLPLYVTLAFIAGIVAEGLNFDLELSLPGPVDLFKLSAGFASFG